MNKWWAIVIILGIAGCHTMKENDHAAALRETMLTGTFTDARSAGLSLLILPLFTTPSDSTKDDIVRFLGQPDYATSDAICYRTGGGPLWVDFDNNRLTGTHLVTPPRWRGTDEELAEWWTITREQENWYEN